MRKPGEIAEIYRQMGLPSNFCPVPFTTLILEGNANACFCRRKGSEFPIGNIKSQSIPEIWNGEQLKKIREEFLSGEVRTCAAEIARDFCHLSIDNADDLAELELNVHQTHLPRKFSPNLGSTCNIRCRMCHIWNFKSDLFRELQFFERMAPEILPHVRELDLFGGEPFIQKETFELIELGAKLNAGIQWSFTTNGNWVLTDRIREQLDKISIRNFIFSIDSLDPVVFSTIRKGASLERVLQTFEDLVTYEKQRLERGLSSLSININFLMQYDNWKDVPAMLAFRNTKQARVCFRALLEPTEFSITTLSPGEKRKIFDFFMSEISSQDLHLVARLISVLLEDMNPLDRAVCINAFGEQVRGQSFPPS